MLFISPEKPESRVGASSISVMGRQHLGGCEAYTVLTSSITH